MLYYNCLGFVIRPGTYLGDVPVHNLLIACPLAALSKRLRLEASIEPVPIPLKTFVVVSIEVSLCPSEVAYLLSSLPKPMIKRVLRITL